MVPTAHARICAAAFRNGASIGLLDVMRLGADLRLRASLPSALSCGIRLRARPWLTWSTGRSALLLPRHALATCDIQSRFSCVDFHVTGQMTDEDSWASVIGRGRGFIRHGLYSIVCFGSFVS